MSQTQPEPKSSENIVPKRKLFFALLVSLAILVYYFQGHDWHKIYASANQANLPLAFAAVFILVINHWFFEVYLRGTHFIWFHKDLNGQFPWRDYFWMRGALYLILLINGPLSGAARVLYLVNKTQISWTLYFGIAFFRIVLRAGLIAAVMLACSWLLITKGLLSDTGIPLFYWFAFIAWNLFVFVDFYFAFFHQRYFGVSRLIKSRINHEVFAPFRDASRYQWAWTLVVGCIPIIIFLLCYWALAQAFGIEVPFWFFSITIAFVLIISNLPIAFGGFGTTTMAWMLFYSDYADEALILSFTLFLPLARMLVHGAIGLLCLKPALKDFFVLLEQARTNRHMQDKEKAKQDITSLLFGKK